jgi:hypothetical protein
VDHVLVIFLLAGGWVTFVLAFPTKRCNCAGHCPRCRGTGKRFRVGARHVRKALLALWGQWKEWRRE